MEAVAGIRDGAIDGATHGSVNWAIVEAATTNAADLACHWVIQQDSETKGVSRNLKSKINCKGERNER